MHKKERQNILISLIKAEPIAKQDVLAKKLAKNGVSVTQASISRDLEELGVIKSRGYYEMPKVAAPLLELGLQALETAGQCLIVGKCSAGLASAITVRIDNGRIEEIVGTIAGDDTIFIAVKNAADQADAMKKVWDLFSH